jgi:hypothetical protein
LRQGKFLLWLAYHSRSGARRLNESLDVIRPTAGRGNRE